MAGTVTSITFGDGTTMPCYDCVDIGQMPDGADNCEPLSDECSVTVEWAAGAQDALAAMLPPATHEDLWEQVAQVVNRAAAAGRWDYTLGYIF